MKKFIIIAALFAIPGMAQAEGDQKLTVDLKIGTDVQNRDIVGEADAFDVATPQLAAWTRVVGAGQPTQIWHVWKRNGEEVSKVALNVTSSYFRTYSRKEVKGEAGNWSVEVRDADNAVIASKDFTVGASDDKK